MAYIDERKLPPNNNYTVHIAQIIIVNKRRKRVTLMEDTLDGKSMHRWLCDTREKAIRDALKELGWTPPSDSSKSCFGRFL